MRRFNRNHPAEGRPLGEPDDLEDDEDIPLTMNDEDWEALLPDDDYEPLPEYGDFWPETD